MSPEKQRANPKPESDRPLWYCPPVKSFWLGVGCAAALSVGLQSLGLLGASVAFAQQGDASEPPEEQTVLAPGGSGEEQPDATRLDVDRLPPEAISLSRDLYASGFFVEAMLGARGFVGGVGDVSDVGPWLRVAFGYELLPWLHFGVAGEASMHPTDAPAPPSATAFEIIDITAMLRLQGNISARAALWLAGDFGIGFATSDVLRSYGLADATSVGLVYGGQAGFDWHFRTQHHSIGLAGGARLHPNLNGPNGSTAIGVHGSAYLRYVF